MCNCNELNINNVIRYRATSVAVTAGVTTITIPASPVINPGDVIEVLLATPIPAGTDGTQITITNGTITGDLNLGNNTLKLGSHNINNVLANNYLDISQILKIFGRCRG